MAWPEVPEDLLVGPRGRRLCFDVVSPHGPGCLPDNCPAWVAVTVENASADPEHLASELASLVSQADLEGMAELSNPASLLEPLSDSVGGAMYWQPPDEIDQALAHPQVAEELAAMARAVTAAPASRWWSSLLARNHQHFVRLLIGETDHGLTAEPPDLSGADANLASWLADTIEEERSAVSRPTDPAAPYSGHWWSAPALSRLVWSTRSLRDFGPVGMILVEDAPGHSEAITWPLTVTPDVRVFEVRAPQDWVELAGRYPLEVTKSRRHDWWRVTGWDGTWVVPNFAAIAADFDAVHLTVGGYLTTAGRALSVGGGVGVPHGSSGGGIARTEEAKTMLAGWPPDETYWLADVLQTTGRPVRWANPAPGDDFLAWTPLPQA